MSLGFVVSFALMTWFIIAVLFRKSQRLAIGLAVGGALSFYAAVLTGSRRGVARGILVLAVPAWTR